MAEHDATRNSVPSTGRRPVYVAALLALVAAILIAPATALAAPYCPPGVEPHFALGFAALKAHLGAPMGAPLECEHGHPPTGDTHQRTTTGLAYFRASTGRPSFTNGHDHWALTSHGLVHWVGEAVDPPAGAELGAVGKPGRIAGAFNVRSEPRIASSTFIGQLGHNTPVWVEASVRGADGDVWYRLGGGEYVHSSGVRLPRTPPRTHAGRWIDADLSQPALVTAYEGSQPVFSALAIIGTVANQTPTGSFQILRRVENETMDSETIGIPRESEDGYFLEDVLYTQYFTWGGASLHYNYWSSNFGYPGSHGCLGLTLEDAKWLWDWAGIGTPLEIHY